MKHLALELRTHMENEDKDLTDLSNEYNSAGMFVNLTTQKVGELANTPAGRMTCYICCLVIFFFVVLWLLGWENCIITIV